MKIFKSDNNEIGGKAETLYGKYTKSRKPPHFFDLPLHHYYIKQNPVAPSEFAIIRGHCTKYIFSR